MVQYHQCMTLKTQHMGMLSSTNTQGIAHGRMLSSVPKTIFKFQIMKTRFKFQTTKNRFKPKTYACFHLLHSSHACSYLPKVQKIDFQDDDSNSIYVYGQGFKFLSFKRDSPYFRFQSAFFVVYVSSLISLFTVLSGFLVQFALFLIANTDMDLVIADRVIVNAVMQTICSCQWLLQQLFECSSVGNLQLMPLI